MPDDNFMYQLIAAFKQHRSLSDYNQIMQQFLDIAQNAPFDIVHIARLIMDRFPHGGTFFDAALSFLPLSDWPLIVQEAIIALHQNADNEAAHSILEYASLQCPSALTPYTTEIMKLSKKLYIPEFDDLPTLYPTQALHIAFPDEYLSVLQEKRSPKVEDHIHPTWIEAPVNTPKHTFGGISDAYCHTCSQHLRHIITFKPVPDGLGVTALPKLDLSVCLTCLSLSNDVLSYQHDTDGYPHDISHISRFPEFADTQEYFHFAPTPVALVNLGSRWQRQSWGHSNNRENLHRVGGHPSWIQNAEYKSCPLCGNTSRFLMQLDENIIFVDEQTNTIGVWQWSVGGMCYVLWCDTCKVSSFFEQTT